MTHCEQTLNSLQGDDANGVGDGVGGVVAEEGCGVGPGVATTTTFVAVI